MMWHSLFAFLQTVAVAEALSLINNKSPQRYMGVLIQVLNADRFTNERRDPEPTTKPYEDYIRKELEKRFQHRLWTEKPMTLNQNAFVPCRSHQEFNFACHYCLVATVGKLCELLEEKDEIKMPILESDDSLLELYEAALEAILHATDLQMAQGIAHAAIVKEEYHGHEFVDSEIESAKPEGL